ncbi:electron transfer flavoprotein subunit beta [Prosthecochloris sp. ZM]|uniref:electron transfer flavoprotein subunit beta/FixA family protein n=1 Tax=Prosthecochloris sp. ZM TaxID=2283143 RepID=UPI000DF75449|nr:electron transfer flavoprotein subunit beta/FixA family protein [Prosthecochloris sp. ZM]RDD31357.1 electron transfer flavoprotein subunit beta [Prosthecochloris sp. ZM]
MNIAVCINQVPDTASRIEVLDGKIDSSRLNMVLNPYDEYALEEAARLKEQGSAVVFTLFSAGDASRVAAMRKALAFGADEAVLAQGEEPSDSHQAAGMLAEAMKLHYGDCLPDLVLCGRESSGLNRGEVPYLLARMLGIGVAGRVVRLESSGRELCLQREADGGVEVLKGRLPLVITAEKGLNRPRKTGVKAMMKARKAPVHMIEVSAAPAPGMKVSSIHPLDRTRSCRMVESVSELVPLFEEVVGEDGDW